MNDGGNATKCRPSLVIGYGNPLRGDDGVGWRVVEEFKARRESPEREVAAYQQLVPELAERISRAGIVCFVDATGVGVPGEWRCHAVHGERAASALGHYATPAEVLALALDLYGSAPSAFLFTMCGDSFECGEELSAAVASAVPSVVSAIVDRLTTARSC